MAPDGERYRAGLAGAEIGASPSPQLHGREADELGLQRLYQLVAIDEPGVRTAEASSLPAGARGIGLRRLSITGRCMRVVVRHLGVLSPAAVALGAGHTVAFADGRMTGRNTDSSGSAAAFAGGLPGAAIGHLAVLGRGCGAPAAAHGARQLGARRFTIVDVAHARASGGWSVASAGLVSAARRTWIEAEIQEVGGACDAAAASPELTARPGARSPKPPGPFTPVASLRGGESKVVAMSTSPTERRG